MAGETDIQSQETQVQSQEEVKALLAQGDALASVGNYADSIAAYGDAAVMRPDLAEAHCSQGLALYEMGRFEDAVAAHQRAIQARPGYAKAYAYLGRTLTALGQHMAAIRTLEQAAGAKSGYAKAHFFLGLTHMDVGNTKAAIRAFRHAIAIKPNYEKAHYHLAMAHLAGGDHVEAHDVCNTYLEEYPGNTRLMGFKAIVLRETGDDKGAAAIMDYDRFLKSAAIAPPDGFDSLDAFNRALADHVGKHSSLVHEPTSRATRGGMHTGEILTEPEGPLVHLAAVMREQVRAYMAERAKERELTLGNHPFPDAMPENWSIGGWSVIMDSQGYEQTHIHPEGWLSGVYYVQIPDGVSADGGGQDGWLEFGRPREHYPCKAEHEIRALRPEAGIMRMFPSYFYHRTIPFTGDEQRICIAFDVKPE